MPAVPPTPRVKLRTTSRRVPRVRTADPDGSTVVETEPNMRLSRAIMVMLLLHVVAVGGILAFSLIKERGSNHSTSDLNGAPIEAEDSNLPSTKGGNADAAREKTDRGGPRANIHVVQPGETLTRIANENGVSVDALVAANGGGTTTSNLRPGLQLKLPTKAPEPGANPPDGASEMVDRIEGNRSATNPPSATPPPKNSRLPSDSGKTYVVGKGESPYLIAQKLKVNYEALLKLNQIDDPKKLKPGQRLRVPAAVPAPTPAKPKTK